MTRPNQGLSTGRREKLGTRLRKQYGYLLFYLFHCLTRSPSTQYNPCLNSIPFLEFSWDHLRSKVGTICSPFWGSFVAWGPFAVGSLLRYCTVVAIRLRFSSATQFYEYNVNTQRILWKVLNYKNCSRHEDVCYGHILVKRLQFSLALFSTSI